MASPSPAGEGTDPVLAAEKEHLASSREFLRLMRDDVLSLPALAGDRVSQEYLKADLYRRAEALRDLPDTPLFFGRLDYASPPADPGDGGATEPRPGEPRAAGPADPGLDAPGVVVAGVVVAGEAAAGQPVAERFHIGRRHVHDQSGHPVVIDWRAPISRPFYRASQADPMGLARRRRFGFQAGELTAYEDERFRVGPQAGKRPGVADSRLPVPGAAHLQGTAAATEPEAPASRILIEEIERPRSGAMRDIVATIQPQQDDIVRAEVTESVCVQGAPGTGKTAVGLHRVAYLLYAHRERLNRGGVLIVGPNRAFLGYIRNVLPALGEFEVTQTSVPDLLAVVPVRGTDPEQAARIKGDARMAAVLHRALWAHVSAPVEPIMLVRGSRRWRVPADELGELAGELRKRGVRYGTGREMLSHRIAHVILTRMEAAGEACDDRTHQAVRRSSPVRSAVDSIWPKADPVRLVYRLLSDPGLLEAAAADLLSTAEQAAIRWSSVPRSFKAARWSAADAVLIDEVRDLIERTASLAHVVLDEAQDLSPMACRAIGRRCTTGSATVLGDIAQGTTPWAASSWDQLLGHLGKPEATLEVLDTGYRVPRQILDFASRLLSQIAPELAPARSVRQDPGSLVIAPVTAGGMAAALSAVCADALTRPGSVAVIAVDDDVAGLAAMLSGHGLPHAVLDGDVDGSQLLVVPVGLAKGLEFDQVIVVEPGRIAAAEARGLHRLYVALTRAVSRLTVLHAEPLPELLR
jgi:DNA helicase IV